MKKLAAWLTPLSLVAIGWRYPRLIAEAATDTGNNLWIIVWTVAAVSAIVTIAVFPKAAFRLWSIALACGAVATLFSAASLCRCCRRCGYCCSVYSSVTAFRRAVFQRRTRACRISPSSHLAWVAHFIWAVAPEIEYDALNYHLAVPRFYLEAGCLIDLPYFFHSYFAHLPDMFFGLCIALGGGPAAKLANFAAGVASMGAVNSLGQAARYYD